MSGGRRSGDGPDWFSFEVRSNIAKVRSPFMAASRAHTRPVSVTAKVTSKGQITIPVEIRRQLGVKPGDKVRFESNQQGIRLVSDSGESVFEKFRGIGNPGIGSGREAISAYMRKIRGYDENDDVLTGH
jgi:antitoxin PrlF